MIRKLPKESKVIVSGFKFVLGLELLTLAGSYVGWRYVNQDRG
jgi:hypothetical protein